jgi:hypothetical protein
MTRFAGLRAGERYAGDPGVTNPAAARRKTSRRVGSSPGPGASLPRGFWSLIVRPPLARRSYPTRWEIQAVGVRSLRIPIGQRLVDNLARSAMTPSTIWVHTGFLRDRNGGHSVSAVGLPSAGPHRGSRAEDQTTSASMRVRASRFATGPVREDSCPVVARLGLVKIPHHRVLAILTSDQADWSNGLCPPATTPPSPTRVPWLRWCVGPPHEGPRIAAEPPALDSTRPEAQAHG